MAEKFLQKANQEMEKKGTKGDFKAWVKDNMKGKSTCAAAKSIMDMEEKARKKKDDRYEKLNSDIEEQGFRCFNIPLEVGARGFINNRNRSVISHICKIMNIRKVSQVFKNCSKLALLGSYVIWNARHSQDWTSGQYLSP